MGQPLWIARPFTQPFAHLLWATSSYHICHRQSPSSPARLMPTLPKTCNLQHQTLKTSISDNADRLFDAALLKIDHIALHVECNHEVMSVGQYWKHIAAQTRQLSVISTYMHGRFVVSIIYKDVGNKYTANRTDGAWALVCSIIGIYRRRCEQQRSTADGIVNLTKLMAWWKVPSLQLHMQKWVMWAQLCPFRGWFVSPLARLDRVYLCTQEFSVYTKVNVHTRDTAYLHHHRSRELTCRLLKPPRVG